MTDRNIITALDIGTTKIRTLIALANAETGPEIVGFGEAQTQGVRKGSVINIDKTVRSIRESLERARAGFDGVVSTVTVGVSGTHILGFNTSGVTAIRSNEITHDDVLRVVDTAKAIVLPPDREIIHAINREFKVDSIGAVKNPIGMCAKRLEADVHLVTGNLSSISNLLKCVEEAGLALEDLIFSPMAASSSVLSLQEREEGVILVDIGGGTTDIAVWKNGTLAFTHVIPVGGDHFTNDLSVALKISSTDAERIKKESGRVFNLNSYSEGLITVQSVAGPKTREVSSTFVAGVLESRARELFSIVGALLIERVSFIEAPGGVVLTGGGVLLKGMVDLVEHTLMRPVRIGTPSAFGKNTELFNVVNSTVMGLLREAHGKWAVKYREGRAFRKTGPFSRRLGHSIKNVFREMF
jgi:cell division protein FtsA